MHSYEFLIYLQFATELRSFVIPSENEKSRRNSGQEHRLTDHSLCEKYTFYYFLANTTEQSCAALHKKV